MSPAAETRDSLLDAAAALLGEAGLAGTTTQNVARRAGVAEGTIYRHYPSKDALLDAVFIRAWGRLGAALEAQLPGRGEPERRLRSFLPVLLEVMVGHPREAALLRLEFVHLISEVSGCPRPKGAARFIELLEEAIGLAQAAGKARPQLDPQVSAALIYNGISKTWASADPGSDQGRLVAGMQTFLDLALFG
jgi:AcrR family transcriptional regulator